MKFWYDQIVFLFIYFNGKGCFCEHGSACSAHSLYVSLGALIDPEVVLRCTTPLAAPPLAPETRGTPPLE